MAHRSRSQRPSRDYPNGHRSSRDREHTSEKPSRSRTRPTGGRRDESLPQYNHNGHKVTPGIHPEGESGRGGFHLFKFLLICGRSSSTPSTLVNMLWPIVPIAIALHFATPEWHLAIFITNYIAMLPAANLLGFAGQEFSRKMPNKAFAVVLETTFGSVVEIILFMVLLKTSNGDSNVQVIKAAILGSILANLLLCLGSCFVAGGIKNDQQEFHSAVSENGSGLMLVAATALVLPAVFYAYLDQNPHYEANVDVAYNTRLISRGVAIISIIGYLIYIFFQTVSHDGLLHEIYEEDDHKDKDRHKELKKPKLTLIEVIVALVISLACVSLVAISLVLEIPHIVERGVSDAFVGLILIPLVEKISEHLLAIDEAYDNQINMALAHVLGASIQTALFNAPLVVLVGWGIGVAMDYNFAIFDAVALILAVLAVGSFLRDRKSNYLEGVLCVMVYIIIAICAFYFPNPAEHGASGGSAAEGGTSEGGH
ncbi:vacuolar calcium ion transporter /H(+) exchanger [Stemphylium lycopersici]|uniref:Vacuolar calcium ion transporter n=1 Tax=Stemphylium lycopersici TaxID=183478 RepID=A0A364MUD0_STELY|nr:ca2+:h+ antiporter [Stemphylium lycopersici]RAQ99194.1 vacuolar calcium ion transporter /H(+) exchanger [Stemphylium lycopersici]RAR03901.1 vacuolar calcium ion transporter /H(+) exchanger [Stemphylium lycopersici]